MLQRRPCLVNTLLGFPEPPDQTKIDTGIEYINLRDEDRMCFLLFTRIYVGWFVRGLLQCTNELIVKIPVTKVECVFSFTRIYVTWLMRNLLTQGKTIKPWNRSICVTKTECVFFYSRI